jgi:hypothetical protein
MDRLTTLPTPGLPGPRLPSAREQARHALLLLGAPAPARLLVSVHRALFDGDLDMAGLAGLLRDEERAPVPEVCAGLSADLTGTHVALAAWPLEQRLVTPAAARADGLRFVLRVADWVALRAAAGRSAHRLLRELAATVPGGPEALDVRDAVRAALDDPGLRDAVAAERSLRAAVRAKAETLPDRQQWFGRPAVPHQRGRA